MPRRFVSRCWLALSLVALAGCEGPEVLEPWPTLPNTPALTGMQRLTVAHYKNAITDVLGDVVVPTAIEPDTSLEGFVSIGSSVSAISPRGVEQYETAAYQIAEQALATEAKRAALVPCSPSAAGDIKCADAFVKSFGRRMWRRTLTGEESLPIALLIANAAEALGDFYEGVAFGIAAILQSPNFLYRPGFGEPDPDLPGQTRYTNWEMATRLSFFLWNGPPDDELLDAAERGDLTRFSSLADQANRMLNDVKARRGLRNFITEYLRLDELDHLDKDPKIFTYYSPEVGPAAREETLLDYEHLVFDEDSDMRDIFTTRRTFVNGKLASMYAVPAPLADGFAEVELPSSLRRRGLLGHVSVLALNAHPTSSSATLRGKFIRTTLLCGTIPPPPVNVNTALPEPSGTTLTLRDRVAEHLVDPFCASCHLQMDPLGLGLENFDSIGRFRERDNGALIDASGDLDGVPFEDAEGLALAVRNHPALVSCFVRQMFAYATSFHDRGEDRPTINALADDFRYSGHKVKALMLRIATSPAFRLVGPTPEENNP